MEPEKSSEKLVWILVSEDDEFHLIFDVWQQDTLVQLKK